MSTSACVRRIVTLAARRYAQQSPTACSHAPLTWSVPSDELAIAKDASLSLAYALTLPISRSSEGPPTAPRTPAPPETSRVRGAAAATRAEQQQQQSDEDNEDRRRGGEEPEERAAPLGLFPSSSLLYRVSRSSRARSQGKKSSHGGRVYWVVRGGQVMAGTYSTSGVVWGFGGCPCLCTDENERNERNERNETK